MKRIMRRTFIVLMTVAAVLYLYTGAALAQSNDQVLVSPLMEAAPQSVTTYWTPQMMANAKPLPLQVVPETQKAALEANLKAEPPGPALIAGSGPPGSVPSEQFAETSQLLAEPQPLFGTYPFSYTRYRLFPDTTAPYQTFPLKTVGKLYFVIPGSGNYVCSGSVINSANTSVVWTAGHCVYSPGIGFHTNFIFVPGRRLTSAPYGTWTAKTVNTLVGWSNGLLEYDHGALVMNKKAKTIGNTVGFLGFVANASRLQHWHSLGYPQGARNLAQTPPGAQFDGLHQEICASSWATNDLPTGGALDPPTIGIGCDQTGGCSGGPWLVDFSGAGGATNLLNGNNSYRWTGPNPPENLKMFSPYFSDGAINLRNWAQAVPVP